MLSNELEAFRAAHDCDEAEWTYETRDGKLVFHCEDCGKECFDE